MFKNPLKYQAGGTAPTQQQQEQLVQLFQAAAKNAQVDPEALVQKAQELGQDENMAAQFMEGLQRCAQGDPAGINFIKSLFTQSAKFGGKIQDFVCKHAKGGNIESCGCGCKTEKYQNPAGPIGRRQALDAAKTNYGFNDSQSRMAYANAKNALRSQGLRGSELRQRARQVLAGNSEVKVPVVRPSLASKPIATIDDSSLVKPMPENSLGSLAGGSAELQLRNNSKMIQDYSNLDFNSAFAAARNAYLNNNGANAFNWKGRTYNTDLASRQIQQVPSRMAQAPSKMTQTVESAQNYMHTNAPATIGAVSYDGYAYGVEALKNLWNKIFHKENGGIIETQGGTAISGFQKERIPETLQNK